MNFKQITQKAKPDLIFFIFGFLVFPAVIIIAIYSIFRVKEENTPVVSFPIDSLSVSIEEVPRSNNTNSSSNSEQPMTSSTSTIRTGHSEEGLIKSIENINTIKQTGNWNATQYSQGDIVKNTYVVQLGDTLWQIANAYYGNGADWTKILEANSNSIGFLPDGEQALIVPGQILVLP